ncbi:hypothetical protein C1I63_08290 [Rathayibacter caricis DSM 15933]|uniref:Recombinase domain-containing protein n=1 Tax=Rathayibacter caricis DSM 15933 TaxID=1328867 RepID=A0A2T4UTJ9_9MICO|nr:recombinase family protein [Rathayibacter caricis]PTL72845.1 hypothetical protein C1I63_08290 [Rathayibacter caricis DSM 15933]
MSTLRVGIYARVSVVKAKDGKTEYDSSGSIESQLAVCRGLASSHGATEVQEFVDSGVSGFSGGRRPGFSALLAALDCGELDLVATRHMDRPARNEQEADLFRYALTRAKVPVVTQGGTLVEPWTASGGLVAKMTAAVAEYESVLKSERLLNHYDRLRSAGRLTASQKVFGYAADGLALDPVEADEIRKMYKTILSGGTIYSILTDLNSRGVPTAGKADRWSHAAVVSVLRRPKNAGLVRLPDKIERTTDNRRRKIPQPGYVEGIVGAWEPIVSKDEYDAVMAILGDPKRKTGPGSKPRYLLAGIIRCGTCGAPLRSSNSTTNADKTAKIGTYRCRSHAAGDTRKHTAIQIHIADRVGREAIAAAFLFGSKELLPKSEDASTQNLTVELSKVREEYQEAFKFAVQLKNTGADSLVYLNQLAAQEQALEVKIAEQQRESASRVLLVDLREGLFKPGTIKISEVADTKKKLIQRLEGLPIETQRELARQFLEVKVSLSGKGASRVQVHHKIVKTLNGEEKYPDDLPEIDLHAEKWKSQDAT